MAIKVYPYLSPRIIEVLSPTTDVTVQSIYDDIRDWEDEPAHLSYQKLVSGAGKEDLGGGVSVGITVTLLNAQLMFSARTTPLETGTCTTTNSDGIQLIASGGDFINSGVYRGCTAYNDTTDESAVITEITSATQLEMFPLSGGGGSGWTNTDSYIIYPNVSCGIDGGNLVAVDGNGDSIDPVVPSFNTQVVRSSASSATATSQALLEHASFNNMVILDSTSAYSYSDNSSSIIVGTGLYPVNNLADAIMIANQRGFKTIKTITDLNIDSASYDLTGFTILGESHVNTQVIIDSVATVNNLTIYECDVSGTLDGGTTLDRCLVGSLVFFNGHIHDCGLYGTITLGGGEKAVLDHCITVDQDLPPVIDMGGTGQSLAMPFYSGLVTIQDLTSSSEEVGIGLVGGQVTLASSITAGSFIISGVGILVNNATSTTSLSTDGLVSTATIADQVWDEQTSGHTTAGSTGKLISDVENKVDDNQALIISK